MRSHRASMQLRPGEPRLPDWDALPLPDLGPKCHMGQWWGGQECRKGFPRGGLRARGEKTFIALVSVHLSSICSACRHSRDQECVSMSFQALLSAHANACKLGANTASGSMKETKGLVQGEPSETRPSWQALPAVKL